MKILSGVCLFQNFGNSTNRKIPETKLGGKKAEKYDGHHIKEIIFHLLL